MPLSWVDLETTGLDADRDAVLEVACIATDDKLEELGRWSTVLHHPHAERLAGLSPADDVAIDAASELTGINPYVIKMHLANGLWAESARSTTTPAMAETQMGEFLTRLLGDQVGERKGPQLAGSTISFDRSFLRRHMPKAHDLLHYRNLDTTTLNEVARRAWPEVHIARPVESKGHRAMPDVEYSLATLRYYLSALGPTAPALPVVEHLP